MSARIELARVAHLELEPPAAPPRLAAAEYERRVAALRDAVDADWIAVYGDREHFANLSFLCGFDPRFEEAVLLVGRETSLLAVGNEGVDYAELVAAGPSIVLCPSLSLLGQDRTRGVTLPAFLREAGVGAGDRVAVVGWKALGADEWEAAVPAIAAPAFLVDALRAAVGSPELVVDATLALMAAAGGLRAVNGADQLAVFEWAAARASACVARIVAAALPGTREQDAVAAMGYAGEPLSAHVMFASGPEVAVGLRSPTARVLERGDAATTAVGFWGGLSARAGVVAGGADELRSGNAGYLEEMAIPYWGAIAAWYRSLRVGVTGGELHDVVEEALRGARFRPALNPGHLIHLDEWLDSPVRAGSDVAFASGAAVQCDVIPSTNRPGWAANCEDGVALADADLRAELAERYPDLWQRVLARRRFMRDELGIELSDDVLPFSSTPARFSPFWLATDQALVVAS